MDEWPRRPGTVPISWIRTKMLGLNGATSSWLMEICCSRMWCGLMNVTVQLESHRLVTFREKGQPVVYCMRPKHPPKVHVWAGISRCGATQVGIINATCYVDILEASLLPFLKKVYPDGHRFMMNNDPKHTSRYSREWYEQQSINWWKTPASSPNLNPIENVWHALKEFLRNEYKPHNVSELKAGIKAFWRTMTPDVCSKYIGHLIKVIPKCIKERGGPTGY